jgi:hypothetical protein
MNISESVEYAVFEYFSQLWAQHPYLAWSIAHPIFGLTLFLLGIFSLWGLMKAIGRGIEQMWLFLLKTPFRLLQPIFRSIWGSIQRRLGYNSAREVQPIAEADRNFTVDRIDLIVARLQMLNQEQDLLLQELSSLTNLAPERSETTLTTDTQAQYFSAILPKLDKIQH